ncbi:trypsin-like peptidase domain-containing protein [Kitasatospora sp. NPDC004723]|uniref:trypsin-like peptidase domain-containing protein n=1 Tax=Kitasatospora sp. NPDC004723 TaxID=3154288 RepID=UPI0033B34FA7
MSSPSFQPLYVETAQYDGEFWILGSGYLIGGPWVLTCSHNLTSGDVMVRGYEASDESGWSPDAAPKYTWQASVELSCDPDVIDLALLKLKDGPAGIPRARFARLPRNQVVRNARSIGFPHYGQTQNDQGEQVRTRVHLYGDIPTEDSRDSGLLTFNVEKPPRYLPEGSRYSGMSGAAVTVGGQVVGVVRQDAKRDAWALSIVPLTSLGALDSETLGRWQEILGEELGTLTTTESPPEDRPVPESRVPPNRVPLAPPGTSATVLVVPDFAVLTRPDNAEVFESMLADLLRLRDTYGYLKPQVVLIPGGLVHEPSTEAYRTGSLALSRLLTALELTPDQLVVAPGPNDAWFMPDGEKRWDDLIGMLNGLGAVPAPDRLTRERPWAWREFAAQRMAIAVLNSGMSQRGEHRARLGRLQLDDLAALAQRRRAEGWLCVGLVHGSPAHPETERIADSDLFGELLGPHLHLVVHGSPRPYPHRFDHLGSLPVIGASGYSTGGYQILDLGPNPTLWARMYNPNREEWTGDTDVGVEPHQWSRRIW